MDAETQPTIFPEDESAFWREGYIEAFVDTSSEYYQRRIAQSPQFAIPYEGYLWDCLRSVKRITFERFRHEVIRHSNVFVMADDHLVIGRAPPLWPYPRLSVARFQPNALLEALDSLPEDIYVFDSSMAWTVGLTHEYNRKRRICFGVGIAAGCTDRPGRGTT